MNGYFINFLVYTLAMVGIMFLAVVIYKKTSVNSSFGKFGKSLEIIEKLNLSPKKSLYIIQADEEKFLIASDIERTTFLAKLDNNENHFSKQSSNLRVVREKENLSEFVPKMQQIKNDNNVLDVVPEIQRVTQQMKANENKIKKTFSQTMREQSETSQPVMRNLAQRIRLKRG